jgi:hypothetical protein
MTLNFLNGKLPWSSYSSDEIKDIKEKCFNNPETFLWPNTIFNNEEVRNIFHAIKGLEYQDKPDYAYIRTQLLSMHNTQKLKEQTLASTITIREKRKHIQKKEYLNDCTKKLKVNNGEVFNVEKRSTLLVPTISVKNPFRIVIDVKYFKNYISNT